jgi:hypothetical protein
MAVMIAGAGTLTKLGTPEPAHRRTAGLEALILSAATAPHGSRIQRLTTIFSRNGALLRANLTNMWRRLYYYSTAVTPKLATHIVQRRS